MENISAQFLSERCSCVDVFYFMKNNETGSHLLVTLCCASFKVEPTQFVFILTIVG